MRFLTSTVGPNSSASATRGLSDRRTDVLRIPGLPCDVGGLHPRLEHLIPVHEDLDHLARPLATSTETASVLGLRRGARRTAAYVESPTITPASRR